MTILTIIGIMLLSTVVTIGTLYVIGNLVLPFFGVKLSIKIKIYKAKALQYFNSKDNH